MRCRGGKLPRHLRPLRVGTVKLTEMFCSGGSRRCLYTDADELAHGLDEDRARDMCTHELGRGETRLDSDMTGHERTHVWTPQLF